MTFSSTQRKWRGSTGEEKLTTSRRAQQTADALQDVVTGCRLGTSAKIYWKVIQRQEESEKKREKASMGGPEEKVKRENKKKEKAV